MDLREFVWNSTYRYGKEWAIWLVSFYCPSEGDEVRIRFEHSVCLLETDCWSADKQKRGQRITFVPTQSDLHEDSSRSNYPCKTTETFSELSRIVFYPIGSVTNRWVPVSSFFYCWQQKIVIRFHLNSQKKWGTSWRKLVHHRGGTTSLCLLSNVDDAQSVEIKRVNLFLYGWREVIGTNHRNNVIDTSHLK